MQGQANAHASPPQPCLVGREAELRTLATLLDPEGPLVAHVHGAPGIGKSALLRTFVAMARDRGHAAKLLDCRAVEPTELAMVQAISDLAIGDSGNPVRPAVVCLDNYDHFLLLDSWIRTHLVDRLGGSVRLVLCRRAQPNPAWLSAAGVFLGLKMRELDEKSASVLVHKAGIRDDEMRVVLRFAKGHPLALQLACAAVRNHAGEALEDVALHDVVGQLTGFFLDGTTDAHTRRAIEAASAVRRVTAPLLGELLEVDEPQSTYDALADLPIFERRMDGLALHPAVHEALAKHLRSSDPARFLSHRRIAWRSLEDQGMQVGPDDLWRYTADAIYLVDNPVVRGAFFPEGVQRLAVELATPADRDAVLEIAARSGAVTDAAAMTGLWDALPHAFRVVRDVSRTVVGFYCMFDPTTAPATALAEDPMAAAWLADLPTGMRSEPGTTLFLRRWLSSEAGEAPSSVQAACWLDVKRSYLSMRPRIQRVYLALQDLAPYAAVARQLGFVGACAGAGLPLASAMLDFGPGSVDGWLRRLVRHELGLQDEMVVDRGRRAVRVGSDWVELTPMEFGVMSTLLDAGGAVVGRRRLLDLVWGDRQEAVGSNVVDVVVRALRKKLDRHSGSIVTVRGAGYRMRT